MIKGQKSVEYIFGRIFQMINDVEVPKPNNSPLWHLLEQWNLLGSVHLLSK